MEGRESKLQGAFLETGELLSFSLWSLNVQSEEGVPAWLPYV